MIQIRALVVDDEPPARRRLRRMLEAAGTEVVGEAEDGASALTAVEHLKPEVVFLDVRMPGLDGITLAQQQRGLPPIVFCTAYDEFAVEAFEVGAVDYLLKPVRPERLEQALARIVARRSTPTEKSAVGATLQALAPSAASTRVISTVRGEVRFFDAREVTRFWSNEKYTVFVADGSEQLTEESLVDLEARLAVHGFFRVHRSELVRLSAVKVLKASDGLAAVELSDGQVAKVSRRLMDSVRSALGMNGHSSVSW